MGSSHPAHTYVETEASSFCPGDLVAGRIKILVNKAIPAGLLSIQLNCIAHSYWNTGLMNTGSTYADKKTLLKLQFPIWNFEVSIAEGQYELPFSIQLPAEMVPSFKYHIFSTQGSVEHSIEAIIGDNRDIMSHNAVIWINKNPSSIVSTVSAEANFKVSNCFCLNSGTTNLKSTLNLSLANENEELIITSQIVNSNNRYNINAIRCSLIRTLRLKAKDILISKSMVFSYAMKEDSQSLNIRAGQSSAVEAKFEFDLKSLLDLWKMPSISTELVDCEYHVKVELVFDNSCGYGPYEVTLPVEIANGDKVVDYKLSEPPKMDVEWNPIMISEVTVSAEDFPEVLTDNETDQKGNSQEAITGDKATDKVTIKTLATESTPLIS